MNDGVEAAEEHPAGESRRAGARRPVAPRRRPPPQRGAKGQVARVIVLVATLGLLGVGVAVVLTVTRDNGRSAAKQSFAPTATATPTAAAKRRTAKGAPALPLTNAQKASRNAAIDQMRSQGFEPVATSTYDPRQSLRVLIGRPKASSTGVRGRRAFFFVREQYIGTDSASPSLRLKVAGQKGGQITLAYTRFAAGDKACCPSDGTVKVRFRLDGSRLAPLDPIPPAAARLPPA
ncbi:MAG: LppP/LprE family lipoprotein [Solirubrobacteraceae bacterium]